MTINIAQGQTIQNIFLYLLQHVLSHSKFYVALSRAISMSTIKVLVLIEQHKRQKGTYIKNIINKDV